MAVLESKNLEAQFIDTGGETSPLDGFWSGFADLEHEATARKAIYQEHFVTPMAIQTTQDLASAVEVHWTVAESSPPQADEPPREGVPADLSEFASHVLRDRFPADIEDQIERAWGD